jgi:alkanesulfonate monooxygenase SsuD/methylene tetrahydromethanopterin reductase-like flavin-dependent oxidoreductase (luciferase family)
VGLPVRFGVVHDFRCPPGSAFTMQDVYAQTIEQVALMDECGLDLAWFSEHHFVEDGYLPNFVPVAAAVAARTKHIRMSTDVALSSFAHPLRMAEDMAILDLISGGRMELGLGLGYAPHEFKAFGVPLKHRPSLMDELLEILRLAWSGERFSFHGRRWQFDDVRVTPDPVQAGGPPLWLAMSSPAGVARAVRFGMHILPQGPVEMLPEWRDAMTAAGQDPAERRRGIIRTFFVTDDRDRDWPPLRAAERYRMQVYGGFSEDAGTGGKEKFNEPDRIPQRVVIGDAARCIAEMTTFIRDYDLTDVVTWGSAPGMQPAAFTPSMERFAREVVPGVRAALATP